MKEDPANSLPRTCSSAAAAASSSKPYPIKTTSSVKHDSKLTNFPKYWPDSVTHQLSRVGVKCQGNKANASHVQILGQVGSHRKILILFIDSAN